MRGIIILAGGHSSRFGRDKALLNFGGKPLIAHVLGNLRGLADEYVVSISRTDVADDFQRILPSDVLLAEDVVDFQGPLAGFASSLSKCGCKDCFLVACDMPSIEPKTVEYLFQKAENSAGAVPKWRDGRLEPLHAVYDCNAARVASRQVIQEGAVSMISMVDHLPSVQFVSVEDELSPLDPELRTFLNLNTPRDLEKIERDYLSRRSQ